MAKQDPKELKQIKDLLLEIERIYNKIGVANPFSGKEAKDFVNNIGSLKDALEDANDALFSMDDGIGDLVNSWRAVSDEVKSHYNTVSRSKSSLSSLTNIAEKLKNHQKGISDLSVKELKSLQEQYKVQVESLKTSKTALEQNISSLSSRNNLTREELKQLAQSQSIYANINGLLEEQDSILYKTSEKLDEEIKLGEDFNKQLGFAPQLAAGAEKAMSKLGLPDIGISDALSKTKMLGKVASQTGGQFNAMSSFAGNMGKGLSGAASKANILMFIIEQLVEAMIKVDNGAGEMAKSMNMTYDEALGVTRNLGTMAQLSGETAVTTKGLQDSYMAIGQSLGSNAMAAEETLITMTKLREQAGYTNDQLVELNKLTAINGGSLEDNTKEILGGAQAYASQKGLVLNEKQILDDVVKASASLKLSFGGSADALARAAVQTRAVGLNLEQAAAMSEQLLQFESSIENELSAELLTGKDLNFERARQLALNNDIAGAAEEIANQVGSSADFAEMNAIQQEAIAKAAGLTKDQLAQSLIDREALAKLSNVEGKDAQEKFNNLVKQVGMEEAKKQLGDEMLATQFQQQSVQERFNQTILKLQEIFVQLAEPILGFISPLMDLINIIMPAISFNAQLASMSFKMVGDMIKTYINEPLKAMTSYFDALKDFKNLDFAEGFKKMGSGMLRMILLPFQTILAGGITALNGEIEMLNKIPGVEIPLIPSINLTDLITGDDVVSSGYGKRMLFDKGEIIALNDDDNIIATTNSINPVSKGDDMYSKGAITVSNSTAPKKETPVDSNAGTNARLDALIAMTGKVNAIPTLRIQ